MTRHPFAVGDRVRVPASGRTGTVIRTPKRTSGRSDSWMQAHLFVTVAWDTPVMNIRESKVSPTILERID